MDSADGALRGAAHVFMCSLQTDREGSEKVKIKLCSVKVIFLCLISQQPLLAFLCLVCVRQQSGDYRRRTHTKQRNVSCWL